MKYRLYSIILTLTVMVVVSPTLSYGHTTKTETSCCKTETTVPSNTKDCCSSNASESDSTDTSCGCDGKCNNSNCNCPKTVFPIVFTLYSKSKDLHHFVFSTKTNFYYMQNHLSDGFKFIWTPPNIG